MPKEKYDFAGWVTKNDTRCSDGVVIKHGAFKDNDQKTVPLVWNHNHSEPTNVLGHVMLHNDEKGVYGYELLILEFHSGWQFLDFQLGNICTCLHTISPIGHRE